MPPFHRSVHGMPTRSSKTRPASTRAFTSSWATTTTSCSSIQQNEPQKLKAFIAWLLGATKGFAPKLVNPGGVEVWKSHQGGNVHSLDQPVDHFDVTPRQIISGVAQAAGELRLPHPVHIHCNNLGMPGNWQTTLETMKALDGHRAHITHIQFHSYGGGEGDENTFNSKTVPLAEYVNAHKNVTIDVGQVMFGETTSMTGDGPLGYYLSNIFKGKWFSSDTEMESGCGITPIKYRNKSLVHSLQWAIGLEWYLLVDDPWRVVMSTDHPNGGSFLAYPQIIRLLMDRTYRQDVLKKCPAKSCRAIARCSISTANTRWTRLPSSPARARREFWACTIKGTWARAPMPTSRSTRRTRIRKSCSSCRE